MLSGVAYGLYAGTAWNGLIYLVERNKLGTAMGLTAALLNLTLSVLPALFGYVHDHTLDDDHGYMWPAALSTGFGCVSLVASLFNYCYDLYLNEGMLHINVTERNLLFERRKVRAASEQATLNEVRERVQEREQLDSPDDDED